MSKILGSLVLAGWLCIGMLLLGFVYHVKSHDEGIIGGSRTVSRKILHRSLEVCLLIEVKLVYGQVDRHLVAEGHKTNIVILVDILH